MLGWDFDKNDDKVEFTKFPEGIVNIRIVGGVPHTRWTHWMPKHMRSVTCPGNRTCPICEIRNIQKANGEQYSYAMGRRIAIQVINRNTGKLEIMEQGVNFFEEVKEIMIMLAEKGKALHDVDIAVRSRGSGKDGTSYRLDIGEEYPLTEEDKALCEGMMNLAEFFKEHTPEQILAVLDGADWNETMYPDNEKKEATQEDEADEKFELE